MKYATKLLLFIAFLCIGKTVSAQSKVVRTLPAFDRIAISGGYDALILKEGAEEGVVLEVKGIDPDRIITEVEGGKLEIYMKRGSYYDFKATITVTYKSLKSISNSGSTDVIAENAIKGESFKLSSSGSGDVKAAFDVKDLDISISGSSDMRLSGNAARQDFSISGSGDIDAKALKGEEASVSISGSGDVDLAVKGKVKTSVSGSGSVNNN
jgi:Putative auto-transporter adhesin, head GIN domain